MKPLWSPTQKNIDQAHMTHFMASVNKTYGHNHTSYEDLYSWSITNPVQFWKSIWEFCGVIGDLDEKTILVSDATFYKNRFFENSTLNYAENLMQHLGSMDQAIVFWGEDKVNRTLSGKDLQQQVAKVAAYLKNNGVGLGDRVAGILPNMPETVIAMLATTSLGAIWSSCSPDFGVQGILDRFQQIEPKVLFACDGYYFKGKTIDIADKVFEIQQSLPSTKVLTVNYIGTGDNGFTKILESTQDTLLSFTRVPFNHPLFIMFSSGTTGIPKCIVHGHGGTLLQHLKEHQLHCDIKPDDRVFYYTTCGWMMWNWMVSALATKATLLLYDGSPFYPDWGVLFDYTAQEQATFFGVSAKYIDALHKENAEPGKTYNLKTLRTIASTGSPLAPESFDYVYQHISKDVNLASIAGGTDIVSCFCLGNPIAPVYRGELQTRGLGMAVETFDDSGNSITGQKGELVCTKPFPCMPVMFWNDPGNRKYQSAYFERFPNIWCHGDFVEITDHNGLIIHGRSDAVLNPGGVRIGTAEIYRQVEKVPQVLESIAIGQTWHDDVRIVLFVKLQEGSTLTPDLIQEIKTVIRTNASPRHVPEIILQVPDIPRTISGKIVELAVTEIVHNRPVKNIEALANPEALHYFQNRPELTQTTRHKAS